MISINVCTWYKPVLLKMWYAYNWRYAVGYIAV